MVAIKVSDKGKRICDSHGRARLTQGDVDLMRDLFEAGMGYDRIGYVFCVAKRTVRDVVGYRTWVTLVADVRLIVPQCGK